MTVRVLLVGVLLAGPGSAGLAENVDPGNDGHQWAWSENAGWINAQPLGPGGPGMQVDDFLVTGWLWSENLGWINLSCHNDGSCGVVDFGVLNDGAGQLSGFAWAENAGWIDFAPLGGGVTITAGVVGTFSGWAWGENLGWINFAPDGAGPVAIETSWGCTATAPPSGSPALSVGGGTATRLDWTSTSGADAYDVVRGDAVLLRASGGDYSTSGVVCIGHRLLATSLLNEATHLVPPIGGGFWYLVRGINCFANGTYENAIDPPGHRDAGIAASGGDCP